MSQYLFKRNGRLTPLRSSIFKAKAGMFYCVHANHTSNYAQKNIKLYTGTMRNVIIKNI